MMHKVEPGRANRPGRALRSGRTCRALFSRRPLRPGLALCARRSGRALRAASYRQCRPNGDDRDRNTHWFPQPENAQPFHRR